MIVHFQYFESSALGSFATDLTASFDAAMALGDVKGARALRSLFLDYFEVKLRSRTASQLKRDARSWRVWRALADGTPVFKTADAPCAAFTAQTLKDGAVVLTVLGATYDYGGDEDAWWRTQIEPRVRSL